MIIHRFRKIELFLTLICVSGLTGLLVYQYPLFAFSLVSVVIIFSVGFYLPGSISLLFAECLSICLIGYAFFGRAFAYIGIPPLFVGEILLALGIASVLLSGNRLIGFRSVLGWVVLVFIIWGAVCTLPYLQLYRIDSLRDGVVWGYSFFALLIPPLMVRYSTCDDIISRYSRLLLGFLLWAPISWGAARLLSGSMPALPGTDVPLLALKPGDIAVHLAGVGSFILLGLHRTGLTHSGFNRPPPDWILWLLWLSCFFLISSVNRGGFLAIIAAGFIVLCTQPLRIVRRALTVIAVIIPFVLAITAYDVSINLGGKRSVSIEQIIANVQSISGDSERNELSGTREWRLRWWDEIIDYTFRGPYFWSGKGYGINLADADGFQVSAAGALRSPHNGHLTILARSGVPGLALWVILQSLFAGALISASIRARRTGREHWVAINGWILAYWAAFLINGAFDVFLEGPQGGIWFWCLMGFGIGILQMQREEFRDWGSNLNPVAP
jgi:hypothetical protein